MNDEYAESIVDAKRILAERGITECWSAREVGEVFEIDRFTHGVCWGKRIADGKRVVLSFEQFPARLYFDCREDDRYP